MRKCFKPLVKLTDCDSRLALHLGGCDQSKCLPEITHLVLTQGGCDTYKEVVEYKTCEPRGFGCCTPICIPQVYITQVLEQKGSITYPLHEIDCEGRAVFVLDGKLKTLGYGRYHAQVLQEGCKVLEFDLDYTCDSATIVGISSETNFAMGGRC